MKNSVVANVSFSFKGKVFDLSMPVDLDAVMEGGVGVTEIYSQLAKSNGIDSYSYEYEMMLAEPIEFGDAEGMAVDYLFDSVFDFDRFHAAWHQVRLMRLVSVIAESEMDIDDLEANPALKRALVRAYQCGKEHGWAEAT
ncbi:MAG: hypothetical protein ABW166_01040 [Sedimenticola sp.]